MSVRVDGHVVRRSTLRILQQRALVLPRLFAAGRHRLSVRVVFEPGSGTPAVTLTAHGHGLRHPAATAQLHRVSCRARLHAVGART